MYYPNYEWRNMAKRKNSDGFDDAYWVHHYTILVEGLRTIQKGVLIEEGALTEGVRCINESPRWKKNVIKCDEVGNKHFPARTWQSVFRSGHWDISNLKNEQHKLNFPFLFFLLFLQLKTWRFVNEISVSFRETMQNIFSGSP